MQSTRPTPLCCHPFCQVTGVFLAGGENKRFPSPKAFISLGGEYIIDRSLRLLHSLFPRVLISTNTPELYFSRRTPLVGDILPQRGPMTGILTCLLQASLLPERSDYLFAIACDMPFVQKELAERIVSLADGQADAVVARFKGKTQPFPGAYHTRVAPVLESMINKGIRSMSQALARMNTIFIDEDEEKSFLNINTPEDLQDIAIRYGIAV